MKLAHTFNPSPPPPSPNHPFCWLWCVIRMCTSWGCGKSSLRAIRTRGWVRPILWPQGLWRHFHTREKSYLEYMATWVLWILELGTVEGEREGGRREGERESRAGKRGKGEGREEGREEGGRGGRTGKREGGGRGKITACHHTLQDSCTIFHMTLECLPAEAEETSLSHQPPGSSSSPLPPKPSRASHWCVVGSTQLAVCVHEGDSEIKSCVRVGIYRHAYQPHTGTSTAADSTSTKSCVRVCSVLTRSCRSKGTNINS